MTDPESIAHLATGRQESLFAGDLCHAEAKLIELIGGRRVLAIGAAGSIGAATVRALVMYRPAALHVVDQNENALTELVRDLRSGAQPFAVPDFRALPLDYGAPTMRRFLTDETAYDFILNFAALKHVRSEKDVYSLTQMLDTNLGKQVRLLRWLAELGMRGSYFCVSTDKAANPVNLMGASKRMMEHLIFSSMVAADERGPVTSARFANVAFSEGSLLDGFLYRLEKRQPLAVPRDTRRYFVSLRESGQICLLAAVLAPTRHIVVPRLNEESDLKDIQSIAEGVLQQAGLRVRHYDEEEMAKANLDRDMAAGCYPLLLTPLDTAGEKPYEEFVGEGETTIEIGLSQLAAVPYVGCDQNKLARFIQHLEQLVAGDLQPSKEEIISWIGDVVPNFHHRSSDRQLDQRM